MSLSNIMGLLGGLAIFLYGMQMMSNGLEQTARNQMRDILKKITSNRITGVLPVHLSRLSFSLLPQLRLWLSVLLIQG